MRRTSHLVLAVLLMLPGFLGCSFNISYHRLDGEIMQGEDFEARRRIYVIQQPKDKRQIELMIANRLKRAGFEATAGKGMDGAPAEVDAIVSYEDHWQWDMSMYLIVLRIDFRDPETQELLASGQSYRFSTVRKPPEFMVDEIIASMFAGR
jgi:hypothetical protein